MRLAARDDHALDPSATAEDADHLGIQPDLAPAAHDLGCGGTPHHSWPEPRVVELLDQRPNRPPRLPVHAPQEGSQGEILDPLSRPLRLELPARDPPDLLGVGFEEGEEEPTPEAVG